MEIKIIPIGVRHDLCRSFKDKPMSKPCGNPNEYRRDILMVSRD